VFTHNAEIRPKRSAPPPQPGTEPPHSRCKRQAQQATDWLWLQTNRKNKSPLGAATPAARLLSLLLSADYAPLTVSPDQQKQQPLHALSMILLCIAAQQPVLFAMEDLHWVDPSTLELLTLLVDQGPTARLLALWTFRPDFNPPWTGRSHLTQVTVHRLPHHQAVEVIRRVAHGKILPPEVVEQVVAKTDGVPLFVEELTKMVLESGLLQEGEERYELTGPLPPQAIPATLHDSLMARLDRLAIRPISKPSATAPLASSCSNPCQRRLIIPSKP
jgi:predicted ATPase